MKNDIFENQGCGYLIFGIFRIIWIFKKVIIIFKTFIQSKIYILLYIIYNDNLYYIYIVNIYIYNRVGWPLIGNDDLFEYYDDLEDDL